MFSYKKPILLDAVVTFLCLLGTYWAHNQAFINWDVAWHVEGAKRLLAGGSYLVNTFDNNNPLVFGYFFPVIWLQKLLFIPYSNLIIGYITVTALIPLALGYYIIYKTFDDKKIIVRRLLYYTLVYSLLILPAFNFGHRETVLIYFYLPYFLFMLFSTAHPLTFKENANLSYLTAFLASFGILQNIFYLSIPIFIDLYRYFKFKRFEKFQIFFYCCVLLTILFLYYLYPDYFKHIIPMVLCYESGFNFPLLVLVFEILGFISLLTLTIVLINFRKIYQSDDIIICFIAIVCSLLIYFFELKLWYYHLYPALCFVMILLMLFVAKYYEETCLNTTIRPKINLFSASFAAGMLATIFITVIGFYQSEFRIYRDYQDINNRWLRYVKENFENKKLFFLVIQLGPAYSLPIYSNANVDVVSPWSNPWILPYVIAQKKSGGLFCSPKDITLFQQVTTNAIAKHQPDFIITENPPKGLLNPGRHFDYFTFFSQNEQFAELIKHYRIFGKFDKYTIYRRF